MIGLALGGLALVALVAWFFLMPGKATAAPTPPVKGDKASASSSRAERRSKGSEPAKAGTTPAKVGTTPAKAATAPDQDAKSAATKSDAPPASASSPRPPSSGSNRPSRPVLPRLRLHSDQSDEEDGNTSLTMLGPIVDTTSKGLVRTLTPGAETEEPTQLHSLTLVTAVARTDKGLRRKHNEDSYLLLPEQGVFLVADGMGGHQAGEVASQVAASTTAEIFHSGSFPGAPDPQLPRSADELRRVIVQANDAIFSRAQSDSSLYGMGTTVVAARFSATKRRACVAHVGDSRCYRLREGQFEQLTTDHTIGTATGMAGSLGDRLTRALGIAASVSVDLLLETTQPGDVYLLCSDGLSKMVSDEAISQELNDPSDLPATAQRLVDRANQGGGRDNITVVLIRVDPPAIQ